MKKINIILTSVISFLCLAALILVLVIKNIEQKAEGDGTIIVELLDIDNSIIFLQRYTFLQKLWYLV